MAQRGYILHTIAERKKERERKATRTSLISLVWDFGLGGKGRDGGKGGCKSRV